MTPRLPAVFAQAHHSRRYTFNAGVSLIRSISLNHPMKRSHEKFEEIQQSKRKRVKMTSTDIKLTPRERQLRDLLLDVARYVDESKEIKDEIELRFAGGWVRDKLLGIESHDIDTAINVMTGYTFSLKMKEYLAEDENMKKHLLKAKDVGNLHKIAANPEKSKHLETATIKIFGFDVDFVNLRKETYSEDSRNPQMQFGDAEEDAMRRDATINALFYNLHSDEVEDFAGGLQDLNSKRIRTPLDPYTTFMDDPLRVLRLIRFASRLDFKIDDESERCMSNPAVMDALRVKISRERIGVEVEKMLKDKNPRSALQLFDRLGLYLTIFSDPTSNEVISPSTANWKAAYDCLDELRFNRTPGSIYQVLVRSEDATYLSWILAALTPWATVAHQPPHKPGAKAPLPYATSVAREGIKADNKICSVVTGAFRNCDQIANLKEAIKKREPWIYERDTLGMLIRKWETQGGHWRLQALFAVLVEATKRNNLKGNYDLLFEWQEFVDHLEKMDVMDAVSFKCLVDGTQLWRALGAKPGIWMKPALDVCMAWQLRNPGKTDPSEAIEEVRSRSDELQIPMN